MNINKTRIKNDFEKLEESFFWQEYISRIKRLRQIASRNCETLEVDRVPFYQGQCAVIDMILKLPDQILKEIKESKGTTSTGSPQ